MVMSSFFIGTAVVLVLAGLSFYLFRKFTIEVPELNDVFLVSFGKVQKTFSTSGLYFCPHQLLPWVDVYSISKQIDFRTYKNIHVNDRNGTTVMLDLWIEFSISDSYKALFSVENWEEVLHGVLVHSTASILSSQLVEQILQQRAELAGQLQNIVSKEMERWGINLRSAMIQNIGLLPEVSKQFFESIAAKIERTTALIKEEGRLRVSLLEAETSQKIAELNGHARAQMPLEIGRFYQSLSDPKMIDLFNQYWSVVNFDPKKSITFSGFKENSLDAVDAVRGAESILSH